MPALKTSRSFQVGDRVKLRLSDLRGRIVEFRGPLGPRGMHIYRVRIAGRSKPTYVEVREDQLSAPLMAPKVRLTALAPVSESKPQPPKVKPSRLRGKR